MGHRHARHPPGERRGAPGRPGARRDAAAGAGRRRQLPGGGPADHRRARSSRRRKRDPGGARRAVTDRETLDLYEATGALLRGHFRLTSGLHSDVYLQSALVLQYPNHAEAPCTALAAPFVGVGSLIERSGCANFSVKRATLATVKATTWKPEECPLCKAGGQAIKPGSR